jgi:putative tryptophan/tyrosine transport system substrate-binding protein
MSRKIVCLALCALLFALCVSAQAQQAKKVPRIGYLTGGDPARASTGSEGIKLALRERGYIEGKNIAIEYRYAEGKADRFSELAAELVRLKVDIIVAAGGGRIIQAAKDSTKTIPIVMMGAGVDPVETGLVESLARPAVMSPAFQRFPAYSVASGWSCSKKPFPNLRVSQYSTIQQL